MATISEEHLRWLLGELQSIKDKLPVNTELANGIGNLINRFNLESTSENMATPEKKFFRMMEGIAAIWKNAQGKDKFKFGDLLIKVANLDIQESYPNDLRQILSTAKATAANSAHFALGTSRNTFFASPKSSVVNSEQKQTATPVSRKNP